jgi:16S rRNA (cytosine1402-N4)-methyltransferase|tara:strand:- start:2725 stop:3645 length:921 start_codon:yes stop_codon:yes gene_type:complete
MNPAHVPVMTSEVIAALAIKPGAIHIDCNIGDGGHAEAILNASRDVFLLGIDLDADALDAAEARLSGYVSSIRLVHGNFADVASIAVGSRARDASGVLFDLGVSSRQLDTAERGFSFRQEAPLDMRFDIESRTTAADIVNRYSERDLEAIIRDLGEEPRARAVARAIVRNRRIETTTELARVVTGALNYPAHSRVHPATRTFQALRMAVNSELENLEQGLLGAIETLQKGGRLVTLTYHSIEDRVVKNLMRREAVDCICLPSAPICICDHKASVRLINRRVLTPTREEIRSNPRARSTKMRIAEKL